MRTPTTTQVSTQGRHPWRAALRTFVQTWVPVVAVVVLALPEVIEAIDAEAGAYLPEQFRAILFGASTVATILAALAARVMALDSVGRVIERFKITRPLAPAPVVQLRPTHGTDGKGAYLTGQGGVHRDDDGDGIADGARHYSLGLVAAAAATLMMLPSAVPATAPTLAPPSWCDPAYAVYSGGGWLCLGPAPSDPTEPATEAPARIAGEDRAATAAAISATFWQPGQATTVYLANGNGIDAVSAGASVDGPILLVGTGNNVPAVTLAELARLAPVQVVGLGGPGAVTDAQMVAAQDAAGS